MLKCYLKRFKRYIKLISYSLIGFGLNMYGLQLVCYVSACVMEI